MGAYHRDEIRNIYARLEPNIHVLENTPLFANGEGAVFVEPGVHNKLSLDPAKFHYADAGNYSCGINAAASVPTGPENVPPHYWQSVALYLGRFTHI